MSKKTAWALRPLFGWRSTKAWNIKFNSIFAIELYPDVTQFQDGISDPSLGANFKNKLEIMNDLCNVIRTVLVPGVGADGIISREKDFNNLVKQNLFNRKLALEIEMYMPSMKKMQFDLSKNLLHKMSKIVEEKKKDPGNVLTEAKVDAITVHLEGIKDDLFKFKQNRNLFELCIFGKTKFEDIKGITPTKKPKGKWFSFK